MHREAQNKQANSNELIIFHTIVGNHFNFSYECLVKKQLIIWTLFVLIARKIFNYRINIIDKENSS